MKPHKFSRTNHLRVYLSRDGKKYPISDGTLYLLNGHEKHFLRAKTQMRMVCVFNPPLKGDEVHNSEGFYEISPEE